MKKLVIILLLGMSIPYLSSAQTIIKIAGDVDAKMVKSQVNRSLEYLDIHEPVHLYIVFSERMPKYLKGLTFSVRSVDSVQLIRVRINASLDVKQRINVLAHEMMHVRQYLSGDLTVVNGKKIWKGKAYPFAHRDLRKLPWEAEAYRHDQYLAKVLAEVKPEIPPLVASEFKE